ncbi:hypothetical protein AB0X98_02745 [Rothia koreensis]|jgi:hypothetical protein|uniref:hypothetical protein n=1 Tax=Rothia koreensis TaxID=592378 RepID=UPI003F243D1C
MRKTSSIAALCVLTAIVLTGCSQVEASHKSAISQNGKYETASQLRDAYIEAGGACPSTEETNLSDGGTRIDCDADIAIRAYEAGTAVESGAGIALKSEYNVLLGTNWTVESKALEPLNKVQEKLGGTLEKHSQATKYGGGASSLIPTHKFGSLQEFKDAYKEVGFKCSEVGDDDESQIWSCGNDVYLMMAPERLTLAGIRATETIESEFSDTGKEYLRLNNAVIVSGNHDKLVHASGFFGSFPLGMNE